MKMSSKCTIQFDNNPFGIYYAGQTVSGTAELITARPKTIRSIFITISGFAEVRWTENITKKDNEGKRIQAPETYSSSELYYSSEKYVYGQSGGVQLELPAGKYVFPFQGIIPHNAPTSFNGAYGQIQHEVSVVVDRVMRYNNIFKQPYTVVLPYDLNSNPNHAKPLQKIEEKTFCWSLCCGTKGPMVMSVKVPFGAYAPGQKVRFNIVLDNQSNVHCYDVKVRLMKKVVYTSSSPETKTKEVEVKVADNHCGEVVKLNKAEMNEVLQIPSTTPSSVDSCRIIKVCYTLKFIAKVSRIHRDLKIEFPFSIGTVPLYASITDDGAITTQPGGGRINKPIPPPLFEEDARSEQFESNTFKPRYPVFLSDPSLSTNGASVPSAPPPSAQSNNLYPPINISAIIPSPPGGNVAPAAPTSSIPEAQPLLPPSTTANSPQQINQHNISKTGPNTQHPIEAMGFSLPPDYEPTPNDSSVSIGWK